MVGRVLAVRLVEDSGHHYIIGITGIYDQEAYPSFLDAGVPVNGCDAASATGPDELEAAAVLCVNPHSPAAAEIDTLLADAPPLVSREVRARFDKAVTPLTIVTILLALNLAAANPFLKKLQECAAEDFYKWLTRVFGLLPKKLADRVVLEIPATPTTRCTVRFVNASRSPRGHSRCDYGRARRHRTRATPT